jgi:hypothetical protein
MHRYNRQQDAGGLRIRSSGERRATMDEFRRRRPMPRTPSAWSGSMANRRMKHVRQTCGFGPRESPGLNSHDTQCFPGQTKTAAPVRGRAVSGPWYHPTSQPHTGWLPPSPAARGKCHWGDPITGVVPPPPTAPDGGSERSSEVFFAGVPGSALQLPRFSGPFPPGTHPRQGFNLQMCRLR